MNKFADFCLDASRIMKRESSMKFSIGFVKFSVSNMLFVYAKLSVIVFRYVSMYDWL